MHRAGQRAVKGELRAGLFSVTAGQLNLKAQPQGRHAAVGALGAALQLRRRCPAGGQRHGSARGKCAGGQKDGEQHGAQQQAEKVLFMR